MKMGKALAAINAILVVVTTTHALGQVDRAPESSPADRSENMQPLFPSAISSSQAEDDAAQYSDAPRWTASADFIILDRIGAVPYSLVATAPIPPLTGAATEVLNAADLHQGFAGGPRLGLVRHGDDVDLEFSFFRIDGWDAYRSIGPTPTQLLVMTAPGNFYQTQDDHNYAGQMMTWDYASQFYNAEMNMRWNPWRRVTLLAGFRWAELMEELQGSLAPASSGGGGAFWNTETNNDLYGLQIGAEVKLFERGRLAIEGVLKAGAYDNHAEEASAARMARTWYGDTCTTNHLAFLGETGLQCTYQLAPRLALRAGYEAMWLEGVALASGQIADTYCFGSYPPPAGYVQARGLNCNSGAFYHGATVGLEYSF